METLCLSPVASVANQAGVVFAPGADYTMQSPACRSPQPTVFIVDDDVSFLTAVARMLRASGFVVKTFASAAEVLARSEPEVPGCVPADLQMPGLSGLHLQEALAKAKHRLPVIFLSGHVDIPSTVQAM